MNNLQSESFTVIVADGTFPVNPVPLGYLKNSAKIICCDGSTENLIKAGYIPDAIIGDMDSLGKETAERFADRIFHDVNQDTNDLTKAVQWCRKMNYNNLVIIAATGLREDHTIGNISLLAEYAGFVNVKMVTDTGVFLPFLSKCTVSTFPGQQVSLFSIDPNTEITTDGLKFPLRNMKIANWWVATLNEALGDSFTLDFKNGRVIVYMKYPESSS
jgi:thiamine pyrophosphokinase